MHWEQFKFYPSSPFKIKWDMVVIVLSIWNSISIPFEFAFPESMEGNSSFTVIDYIIDFLFAFDILINFRSIYYDHKTDEPVTDGKKIALTYVFKGRFVIDLLASTPFELIMVIFQGDSEGNSNLKFFGMLKLVRLLRLGRMISYLKTNRSFKFGMKFVQLIFMLILILHWTACVWYVIITSKNPPTWMPPKDLDFRETILYDNDIFQSYLILFYYGVLILVTNELLPTNGLEVAIGALIIFTGLIVLGMLIGEFSSIMSEI